MKCLINKIVACTCRDWVFTIQTLLWGFAQTLVILTGAVFGQSESTPRQLRVMTYNIHHGEGTDERIDLERIAKVIRDARPDLVALQEVDNQTQRTGHVDQTSELARLTKMHGLFGKQIPYEGGEYGQAILSRFPLSTVTIHWLPGEPERQRRIAAATVIDIGSRKIVFASTHLHHQNAEFRERQAEALGDTFLNSEHHVILVGDLNAQPDSPPLKIMERGWKSATTGLTDRLTYPSQSPQRQLDYVLSRKRDNFTVDSSVVIDEKEASDHCPLLVQFSYPD